MDEKEQAYTMKLRVKITDSLEKLVNTVTEDNGGSLFAAGKALTNLNWTVEKANLHDGQQVLVIGSDYGGDPI